MFGLRAKLPVSDEERLWVDEGFRDDRRQGWSMNRLGYLPEEVFACMRWPASQKNAARFVGRGMCIYQLI